MKPSAFFQAVMDEHINLPGVLGVVVTRGFAYQWLKDIGYNPSTRGFGSIDYMVFHQKPRDTPLTDLTEPNMKQFLEGVAQAIRRDCLEVQP